MEMRPPHAALTDHRFIQLTRMRLGLRNKSALPAHRNSNRSDYGSHCIPKGVPLATLFQFRALPQLTRILTASVSCRRRRRRASQANPTSSMQRIGAILNSSRTTFWRMRAAFTRKTASTFANCWPALPQPMQLRSIFLISVISGFTALIHSSCHGDLETTRFLVESGAKRGGEG